MVTRVAESESHGTPWPVIPAEQRGKRPLPAWRQFEGRCASVEEVRHWFEHWPDTNVASVTGLLRPVVVDVDPRHGGTASVVAFEAEHGALPATLESLTRGGAWHRHFRHPGTRLANRVGLAVRGRRAR